MKRTALLLCVGVLFLTGCGTPLITLTDEENSAIVNYAAGILLKHNEKAYKGLNTAQLPEEEEQEEEEEEELPDTSGDATDTSETNSSDSESEEDALTHLDFNQVLDLAGCSLTYEGSEVSDEYEEGTYFVLTPSSGDQYLVLRFKLENTGSETASVDVLSQLASFSVDIDGTDYTVSSTVISNDLSGLITDIAAGESYDAVLLVEVPTGTEPAGSMVLSVTEDDTIGSMNLE